MNFMGHSVSGDHRKVKPPIELPNIIIRKKCSRAISKERIYAGILPLRRGLRSDLDEIEDLSSLRSRVDAKGMADAVSAPADEGVTLSKVDLKQTYSSVI